MLDHFVSLFVHPAWGPLGAIQAGVNLYVWGRYCFLRRRCRR